jgi:carbon-monoxide dehydrogenase medium subunit
MVDFALHSPRSLAEATETLGRYGGEARVIAGGTALVLLMRQGLARPSAIVRLDGVPGLEGIAAVDGSLHLGALATLRSVAASPDVARRAPILGQACGLVGNVRVRNAATIGGNLCEADYASDPPGVLVALDARARVTGVGGQREVGVVDLITDFYETSLAPDEVVSEVLVPPIEPGTRAVYLKFVTRSSEDRPCLGATALLRLDSEGRVADLRAAVGAIAGRPLRLPHVEASCLGEQPSDELFGHVAASYAAAAEPLSDVRGSAGYRKRMVEVFVRRSLAAARDGDVGARKV